MSVQDDWEGLKGKWNDTLCFVNKFLIRVRYHIFTGVTWSILH
jgi:hypothetical protein